MCSQLVNAQGATAGFEHIAIDTPRLLEKTDDEHVIANKDVIVSTLEHSMRRGL